MTWAAGLVGVGRAMRRDLDVQEERKREEERFQREERRAAREGFTRFMENVVQNPHLWPAGADSSAAQMMFDAYTNDFKPTDYQKKMGEFIASTSREWATDRLGLKKAQQQQQTGQTAQQYGQAMQQMPTFLPFMPMDRMGQATQQAGSDLYQQGRQAEQAIPRVTRTGQLQADEIAARGLPIREEELRMQQQYELEAARQKTETEARHQEALYKRKLDMDYEDNPYEKATNQYGGVVLYDKRDPSKKKIQVMEGRGAYPMSGASPRPVGGKKVVFDPATKQTFYENQIFDPQSQTFTTVLTPRPTNLRPELTSAEKADEAGLRVSIQNMDRVVEILADPKVAGSMTGPLDQAAYGIRSTELGAALMGSNDPDLVFARTALSREASQELHRLSGAAVSPMELKRLEQYIPTTQQLWKMNPEQIRQVAAIFRDGLAMLYNARFGPGGVGGTAAFAENVFDTVVADQVVQLDQRYRLAMAGSGDARPVNIFREQPTGAVVPQRGVTQRGANPANTGGGLSPERKAALLDLARGK